MADLRTTEVDGIRVTWRFAECRLIVIMAVDHLGDASPVLVFGPERCTDLSRACELFPDLAKLWDAVRHEFWTDLVPRRS